MYACANERRKARTHKYVSMHGYLYTLNMRTHAYPCADKMSSKHIHVRRTLYVVCLIVRTNEYTRTHIITYTRTRILTYTVRRIMYVVQCTWSMYCPYRNYNAYTSCKPFQRICLPLCMYNNSYSVVIRPLQYNEYDFLIHIH